MNLVFDIESDGLLNTIENIWMIVAIDVDTAEEFIFTNNEDEYPNINAGLDKLASANMLIGHNIIGYDLLALRKVLNWRPPETIKIVDTMLLSQILDYDRFGGRHSLEKWGEYLGRSKVEHEDWSKFSLEMLHRCREDVKINLMVYKHELKELKRISAKKPEIKTSIKNEHMTAQFCAEAEFHGWLFDKEAALKLIAAMEKQMREIESVVQPNLRLEVKRVDKTEKQPKWIKNGNYDANTAKYFGISPEDGKQTRTILGAYNRIEIVQPDLGSLDSVKLYLKRIGWVPDDWNWKKVGREYIKISEKLTTSSLEKLGEVGQLIDKYYTTRSRHSILTGWLNSLDENNRLHGSCFTISTPTGRARHSGIVNVPSADAEWGADIRKLFITSPGYKIIGADSSGNQMRGLLHYLNNNEYTDLVLNGDVHTKNAEILSAELKQEIPRSVAKRFLYAFLFGAGDEKAALTVLGKRDKAKGKQIRQIFTAATPGLDKLIKKLYKVYDATSNEGNPWVPCLDGRKIYVDSQHKLLNYILQSLEAVTCKAATALAIEKLKEANIPYNPLIFYHDEIEFEVPEQYAEQAAIIAKEAFRDAPKQFNVTIMDGEAKIGDNWYDVH